MVNIDLLKGGKGSSNLRNCTKRKVHLQSTTAPSGIPRTLANPAQTISVPTPTPAATLFDQSIITKENQELRAKLSALQDTVTGMAQTLSDLQRNFAHLLSTLNTVDWKLTKE
jgi:hypothetical protein